MREKLLSKRFCAEVHTLTVFARWPHKLHAGNKCLASRFATWGAYKTNCDARANKKPVTDDKLAATVIDN